MLQAQSGLENENQRLLEALRANKALCERCTGKYNPVARQLELFADKKWCPACKQEAAEAVAEGLQQDLLGNNLR